VHHKIPRTRSVSLPFYFQLDTLAAALAPAVTAALGRPPPGSLVSSSMELWITIVMYNVFLGI